MVEHREHRSRCTRFGIGGGKDEPLEARVDHGSRAHGAWFERHVEGAAVEPVIAQRYRRRAHGHDLGVCGRVVVAQNAILAAADDHVFVDGHGPDGHLSGFGSRTGFG